LEEKFIEFPFFKKLKEDHDTVLSCLKIMKLQSYSKGDQVFEYGKQP
jgi:hypothetical protein